MLSFTILAMKWFLTILFYCSNHKQLDNTLVKRCENPSFICGMYFVDLTQKHEHQVELQDVGKAERDADGFRQRNTEEIGFVKDWDGLDNRHSWSQHKRA